MDSLTIPAYLWVTELNCNKGIEMSIGRVLIYNKWSKLGIGLVSESYNDIVDPEKTLSSDFIKMAEDQVVKSLLNANFPLKTV